MNIEPAVVATVGTAGASTVRVATAAGDTTIPVVSTTGFAVGSTITVGSGGSLETAVVASTSSSGGNPRVVVTAALGNAHAVGEQISGSGITLAAPLGLAHSAGATVSGNGLTLSAGLTMQHTGAAAVATVTPAGVTNIKVVSVAGFAVGDTVTIDTGANVETAVIAAIGTAGVAGTGIDLVAPLALTHLGAPAVRVDVGTGRRDQRQAQQRSWATTPATGSRSTPPPTRKSGPSSPSARRARRHRHRPHPGPGPAHFAGVAVTDTRVVPSTAVAGVDYTVPSATVTIPAGSPSGTVVTIPVVTTVESEPLGRPDHQHDRGLHRGLHGRHRQQQRPIDGRHQRPRLPVPRHDPAGRGARRRPDVAHVAVRQGRADGPDAHVGRQQRTRARTTRRGTTSAPGGVGSILSGGDNDPQSQHARPAGPT